VEYRVESYLKERDNLKDLDENGWKILKQVLNEYDWKLLIGFMSLMSGARIGPLKTW
jgi:hypothetical protein